MRNILTLAFLGICLSLSAQKTHRHELSLVVEPLQFNDKSQFNFLYRYAFNDQWSARLGFGAAINAIQEIREDTQALSKGSIDLQARMGIQRHLEHSLNDPFRIYVGLDAYWNSLITKSEDELYYYHYYNFGFNPLVGLSRDFGRIRASLEMRSDFNMNLQSYAGIGLNYDRGFRFETISSFALGLGYTF